MNNIKFDDLVENVCRQNSITRDELTPENWSDIEEFYKTQTGKRPPLRVVKKISKAQTRTLNGVDALAAKGRSSEDVIAEVTQEQDLRALERDNRLRKARSINQKFHRQDQIRKDFDNIDLLNIKANVNAMKESVEDRNNAFDFLFPETNNFLTLAPRSVYLFCAPTNNGKSTLSSSIAESFVRKGKKVLVLVNEEDEVDVRARVSCIRTGVPYGAYKQKLGLPASSYDMVEQDTVQIETQLVVLANDQPHYSYAVTNKDGIVEILEKAAGQFDCIILDYWQRVVKTDENTEAGWEAQRALAPELDRLKKVVGCPIVVFAQIHPIQHKKKPDGAEREASFELNHPYYRWKGSTEILFTATDIVEFNKDYNNKLTHLYAHKCRFKHGAWSPYLVLGFDSQLNTYVPYDVTQIIEEIDSKLDPQDDQQT